MPRRQPRWPSIGIELVQLVHAAGDHVGRQCRSCRPAPAARARVGQELVQRRIQQANRDRPAIHRAEHARRNPRAGRASSFDERLLAVRRACRPGSSRGNRRCGRRTCARCGTGRFLRRRRRSPRAACFGSSALVRTRSRRCSSTQLHQLFVALDSLGLFGLERFGDQHLQDFAGPRFDLTLEDFASESVDRDRVALRVEHLAADGDGPGV